MDGKPTVKLDLGKDLYEGEVSEMNERGERSGVPASNEGTSRQGRKTYDLLGLGGVLADSAEGLASEGHCGEARLGEGGRASKCSKAVSRCTTYSRDSATVRLPSIRTTHTRTTLPPSFSSPRPVLSPPVLLLPRLPLIVSPTSPRPAPVRVAAQ